MKTKTIDRRVGLIKPVHLIYPKKCSILHVPLLPPIILTRSFGGTEKKQWETRFDWVCSCEIAKKTKQKKNKQKNKKKQTKNNKTKQKTNKNPYKI